MLAMGNANRTQHPTDANATSSRSHAVFQVRLGETFIADTLHWSCVWTLGHWPWVLCLPVDWCLEVLNSHLTHILHCIPAAMVLLTFLSSWWLFQFFYLFWTLWKKVGAISSAISLLQHCWPYPPAGYDFAPIWELLHQKVLAATTVATACLAVRHSFALSFPCSLHFSFIASLVSYRLDRLSRACAGRDRCTVHLVVFFLWSGVPSAKATHCWSQCWGAQCQASLGGFGWLRKGYCVQELWCPSEGGSKHQPLLAGSWQLHQCAGWGKCKLKFQDKDEDVLLLESEVLCVNYHSLFYTPLAGVLLSIHVHLWHWPKFCILSISLPACLLFPVKGPHSIPR